MSLVIGSVAASHVAASVHGVRPFRQPVTAVDKANRLISQRQAVTREVSVSHRGRQVEFLPSLNTNATTAAPGIAYGMPVKMLKLMSNQPEAAEHERGTEGSQSAPRHDQSRPEAESEHVQPGRSRETGETPEPAEAPGPRGTDGKPLSEEEMRVIMDLKQRDAEVRQHEQMHLAASGGCARGGAKFQYQSGPDNRRYAVGGEVSIDMSRESTPEATARKMRTVRNAALSPAQPSTQDRQVAAAASRLEMEAVREVIEKSQKASEGSSNPLSETQLDKDSQVIDEEEDSSTPQPGDSASEQARDLHRLRAATQAYGIAA